MDELLSQDEINALLSGDSFTGPSSSDLPIEDAQVLDEVSTIFSNAESSVFGMLAGKEVNVVVGETLVAPQSELRGRLSENPFVFHATFGGFEDVPLVFAVERRGALTLADLMMGGEGKELPGEASELYLNAAQEGLSQVVGSAFTSISGLLGGRRLMPENVSSSLEGEGWMAFPDVGEDGKVWASVSDVSIEGLDPFSVWVSVPLDSARKIAAAIHQIMGENAPKPASPRPTSSPGSASAPSAAASPMPAASRGTQQPAPMVDVHPAEFTPLMPKSPGGAGNSKIDLIADIPVRVTVELGKTRKNISDILGLTTGSVIELDKMAGEPVDVLVNGKLIAKGEVVVIDENFGVRITEVLNTASRVYSI